MDEVDAMYRAGRARQGGTPCPSGGGRSNGGRVAKSAYASGGRVDGGPVMAAPSRQPGAEQAGATRRMDAQEAARPVGLKRGGRAGKGC